MTRSSLMATRVRICLRNAAFVASGPRLVRSTIDQGFMSRAVCCGGTSLSRVSPSTWGRFCDAFVGWNPGLFLRGQIAKTAIVPHDVLPRLRRMHQAECTQGEGELITARCFGQVHELSADVSNREMTDGHIIGLYRLAPNRRSLRCQEREKKGRQSVAFELPHGIECNKAACRLEARRQEGRKNTAPGKLS
jgi:hypothetical protein